MGENGQEERDPVSQTSESADQANTTRENPFFKKESGSQGLSERLTGLPPVQERPLDKPAKPDETGWVAAAGRRELPVSDRTGDIVGSGRR